VPGIDSTGRYIVSFLGNVEHLWSATGLTNNNNNQTPIAPYGRNFRDASVLWLAPCWGE